MAIRTILQYPDPRLRLKCQKVTKFDAALQVLIDDMIETMFTADGMGLAAAQINEQQRIIVGNMDSNNRDPFAIINPEILKAEGEAINDEYCLSVFGVGIPVKRATHLTVTYQDADGQIFTRDVEGLEARFFQHEMDHLDGKVIVDYLTPLKRKLYERKLAKWQKKQKSEQS